MDSADWVLRLRMCASMCDINILFPWGSAGGFCGVGYCNDIVQSQIYYDIIECGASAAALARESGRLACIGQDHRIYNLKIRTLRLELQIKYIPSPIGKYIWVLTFKIKCLSLRKTPKHSNRCHDGHRPQVHYTEQWVDHFQHSSFFVERYVISILWQYPSISRFSASPQQSCLSKGSPMKRKTHGIKTWFIASCRPSYRKVKSPDPVLIESYTTKGIQIGERLLTARVCIL